MKRPGAICTTEKCRNIAERASFVFNGLGVKRAHVIDFIGSYRYPCQP
jgi:hypothetical protein